MNRQLRDDADQIIHAGIQAVMPAAGRPLWLPEKVVRVRPATTTKLLFTAPSPQTVNRLR